MIARWFYSSVREREKERDLLRNDVCVGVVCWLLCASHCLSSRALDAGGMSEHTCVFCCSAVVLGPSVPQAMASSTPALAPLPAPFPHVDAGVIDAQELSRRKSLLAWEDGEGVASDPGDSPIRVTGEPRGLGGTTGQDDAEEPHLSMGYVPRLKDEACRAPHAGYSLLRCTVPR